MSFITSRDQHVFIASGDMLRFFRLGEEQKPKEFFNWSKLSPERIQKPVEGISEPPLKEVEKRVILCIAHSHISTRRLLLAVGTNEKQIHVIEYFLDEHGVFLGSEHVITAVVPKAPTALVFDRNDENVVLGDRAGDLLRFAVRDGIVSPLGGAITMVLDVDFTPDGRHLLMADRDEKVRVMRFPETYVLDCFLLGNTEYVKSVTSQDNDKVWTAGGDMIVRQWSLKEPAEPIRKIDLTEYKKPIRKLLFFKELNKLAVLLENSDRFFIFHLEQSDGQKTTVQLMNEPEFLDVTVCGNFFVSLGRNSCMLLDATNFGQTYVPLAGELVASLKENNDAVENLFKNVTHNNQAEYEKRKAEKFDQIEQQKKRRLNDS